MRILMVRDQFKLLPFCLKKYCGEEVIAFTVFPY